MTVCIREHMTAPVQLIGAHESLTAAQQRMRAFDVRELVVVESGKIVGVIGARHLQSLASLERGDSGARAARGVTTREVMTPSPFLVDAEAPLDEVARTMVAGNHELAVVLRDGQAAGLFCMHDALRALVDALDRLEHHAPRSTRWGHVVD